MKKLKLEELAVASFDTSPAPAAARGTVHGNVEPSNPTFIDTYNIDRCGDTRYFDCTLGCSYLTNCGDCAEVTVICALETADCPT